MCPILSYQNIATLTPVYASPIIKKMRVKKHPKIIGHFWY